MSRKHESHSAATLNSSTPIVVFGLSAGFFHHGALGIARSAGRLAIPVYRVCRERWAPASISRYSRGWRAVPDDFSDEHLRTRHLHDVHDKGDANWSWAQRGMKHYGAAR